MHNLLLAIGLPAAAGLSLLVVVSMLGPSTTRTFFNPGRGSRWRALVAVGIATVGAVAASVAIWYWPTTPGWEMAVMIALLLIGAAVVRLYRRVEDIEVRGSSNTNS
jgi:hypothetical protein